MHPFFIGELPFRISCSLNLAFFGNVLSLHPDSDKLRTCETLQQKVREFDSTSDCERFGLSGDCIGTVDNWAPLPTRNHKKINEPPFIKHNEY